MRHRIVCPWGAGARTNLSSSAPSRGPPVAPVRFVLLFPLSGLCCKKELEGSQNLISKIWTLDIYKITHYENHMKRGIVLYIVTSWISVHNHDQKWRWAKTTPILYAPKSMVFYKYLRKLSPINLVKFFVQIENSSFRMDKSLIIIIIRFPLRTSFFLVPKSYKFKRAVGIFLVVFDRYLRKVET